MTNEQISDILQKKQSANPLFEIRFKTRNPIIGLFIKTADFQELSRKNLWRIVSETHIEEYKNNHNESLARIFNGSEFTKLEHRP
ncbi:MAG TPA: hypothetical protein PLO99_03070 [Chitinophagaceae bacterium]|jgi:hypothetical protein|nr:hypothetical protein [Chitinophagaceae bacterium]